MRHKGTLILVVALAAITVVVGVGTVAGQSAPDCSQVSYVGDGTEENPYQVRSLDQLQCIKEKDMTFINYVQRVDIDATETSNWNGGKGFDPIGEYGPGEIDKTPFSGSFNGSGHTITGLTINRPNEANVGLFGATSGINVENVKLKNADITGSSNVGALIGRTDILSGVDKIKKAYMTGDVTGQEEVGGLIGRNSGTVERSYAVADVSGDDSTGGLVGSHSGKVIQSYATGYVTGDDRVGGLGGEVYGSGQVKNSYATAGVTGDTVVGGLVGENGGNPDGFQDGVTRSYATGNVTGNKKTGGLIGQRDPGIFGGGLTSNSYWDLNTTGQSSSEGGEGLITSEMTGSAAETNMGGFDFANIWQNVTDPADYPTLAWQSKDGPRPANLKISIDSTNSPIVEGDNLSVTVTITNIGDKKDAQTAVVKIPGLSSKAEIPVALDEGESKTKTSVVQTDVTDAGSYTVNVSTEDDFELAEVELAQGSGGGGGGEITTPLPGFTNPPRNIPPSEGGLDDNLVEDLDGDGEVTDITPTVKAFGKLIRGESLGLTAEQAGSLDWDEDNGDSVDIDDMVALFGRQIRAG